MKQQPNRLTEAERQARRQHQIDLGKATQGYRNLLVLRDKGVIPEGPKTPDPTVQNVSKRQFDKEIRDWRRKLHAFDNVDFEVLKAKVYKQSKEEHGEEYLDTLLGKEIRSLVEREMMLRKQPVKRPIRPEPRIEHRPEPLKPPAIRQEKHEILAKRDLRSRVSQWGPSNDPMQRLLVENDVLRMKVQELTYHNTSLLERLHQQDMLLRSLILESDYAAPQGYSKDYDEYSYLFPSSSARADDRKWRYSSATVI